MPLVWALGGASIRMLYSISVITSVSFQTKADLLPSLQGLHSLHDRLWCTVGHLTTLCTL